MKCWHHQENTSFSPAIKKNMLQFCCQKMHPNIPQTCSKHQRSLAIFPAWKFDQGCILELIYIYIYISTGSHHWTFGFGKNTNHLEYLGMLELKNWDWLNMPEHLASQTLTGWWLTYPSEKWWSSSVGIMTYPKNPWFQTTKQLMINHDDFFSFQQFSLLTQPWLGCTLNIFPTIAPDGREVAIDWRWWQAHSHAWSPDQETTASDLKQCQCRPAKKNQGKLRRWLEQCFFGVPWIFELKVYLQDELPPISSHGWNHWRFPCRDTRQRLLMMQPIWRIPTEDWQFFHQ